jgi:hypothetical protein
MVELKLTGLSGWYLRINAFDVSEHVSCIFLGSSIIRKRGPFGVIFHSKHTIGGGFSNILLKLTVV